MILRSLWLIAAIVCGGWLGGKIGTAMSYWFAPSIMRLYLSWPAYLARLPEQLHSADPIGLIPVVITCHLLGTVGGIALGLYVYRRFNRRKS